MNEQTIQRAIDEWATIAGGPHADGEPKVTLAHYIATSLAAGPTGVNLIAAERSRQITTEGWTPEHDDEHERFELAAAARCYTLAAEAVTLSPSEVSLAEYRPAGSLSRSSDWPWHPSWWRPSDDPVRNLVKAGALIAAEIDRLQRGSGVGRD